MMILQPSDTRITGIRYDGAVWCPAFHWFWCINGRVFIGGVN